jgi:hypothetical protein
MCAMKNTGGRGQKEAGSKPLFSCLMHYLQVYGFPMQTGKLLIKEIESEY